MSKIYNMYLKLKQEDDKKLYLFKCGNFYIFIDKDCDLINEYVVLKKVKFCNNCLKCGFPINSLEDYLRVFKNHKLNIQIIEEIEVLKEETIDVKQLISIISKIDINNITPIEAMIELNKIKDLIK